MAARARQTPPPRLLLLMSTLAVVVVAEQRVSPAADDAAVADDDDAGSVRLVPATFAAGDWHVAEGRLGCARGVHRTVVGHTSVNKRQPESLRDTLYIGDEVESVRVWWGDRRRWKFFRFFFSFAFCFIVHGGAPKPQPQPSSPISHPHPTSPRARTRRPFNPSNATVTGQQTKLRACGGSE